MYSKMTDAITLCPDYISSAIHISNKKTQKGIYNGFEYYVGFEKKTKYGYFKHIFLNEYVYIY